MTSSPPNKCDKYQVGHHRRGRGGVSQKMTNDDMMTRGGTTGLKLHQQKKKVLEDPKAVLIPP